MPPDFDNELHQILEQARADGTPFEELQRRVHELFAKHHRPVPPPITGTIVIEEPPDTFGN